MKWTEPKPPTEGVSFYDHVDCETPLGKIRIEWKSWKERPAYGIDLDGGEYIGTEYYLEDAKKTSLNYIENKYKELKKFLEETES